MSMFARMSASGVRSWGVTALPAAAAALLYAWSAWSFGGASAPSTTVAVSVGGAAVLAAGVAYYRLVDGAAGLFGALALVAALLLTVAAADRAAGRGAVADCVVVKVAEENSTSVGEGGGTRVQYVHALRCPGGYPSSLSEDHRLAPDGGKVRVAYDPGRRVDPAVEGSRVPWRQGILAVLLLAAATAGARRFSRGAGPEA
ncbi:MULTISPECIES: hypothetical protein [unclassified Streptomyces]|uniref:hypothetical protein n=1 Tax=unclassified Streptomyces TaxID=2593676 RepID=UPI0006F3E12B|nr:MULTISPECIES: hypothetical protein [unclassified Streptomyces]KQX52886.1 hypothetical protein ASD33_06460 [Streptomyces sp. Root1304]KRA89801.1 hypothetical protein ASE09_06465 [Streptomyces sp. Root66D1]